MELSTPSPSTPPDGHSEADLSNLSNLMGSCIVTEPSPSRKNKVGTLRGRQLQYGEGTISPSTAMPAWTDHEFGALVQFVLLYGSERAWPAHKNMRFWNGAAEFIQVRCETSYLRSGTQG